MKACPTCAELSPDTAVACQRCGTVLDSSMIPRAGSPPSSRAPTLVEEVMRPTPPPPKPGATPANRRGDTSYMPLSSATQAPTGPVASPAFQRAAERRIVGLLITYTWAANGQIYPLREGRNLIGRGEECDVRITADPALSHVNSHITYRQHFVIGDMVSQGGTDLNGVPIEEQFRPLPNYARIRTGSTEWIFIAIDPAKAGGGS